jgi:hypothetical protein
MGGSVGPNGYKSAFMVFPQDIEAFCEVFLLFSRHGTSSPAPMTPLSND